jgi:hypothetical protein
MKKVTQATIDMGRVPTFLIVHGEVLHEITGNKRVILQKGQSVKYNRHGSFQMEYVGDSYAVVGHITPNGKTYKIFIPPHKRAFISCGQWRFMEVNYESFRASFAKTEPADNRSTMFANTYDRNPDSTFLCVSVLVGLTKERFIHVERVDKHYPFTEVKIIGPCNHRRCRENHLMNDKQMLPVSLKLAQAIIGAKGFDKALAEAK